MTCRCEYREGWGVHLVCPPCAAAKYDEGFAAARSAAVAVAQKHMEPVLARRLVVDGKAKTPFAGFLLAMEHLRDDLLYGLSNGGGK